MIENESLCSSFLVCVDSPDIIAHLDYGRELKWYFIAMTEVRGIVLVIVHLQNEIAKITT